MSSRLYKVAIKRVQSDMKEMDDHFRAQVEIPDRSNMLELNLKLVPRQGLWEQVQHDFTVKIPREYPMRPPKVRCKTKIWHPNIDQKGAVCLNILKDLRDGWMPVLTLESVFLGLEFLFAEPNPKDPLNTEAADQYVKDYKGFVKRARKTMKSA